jgi:hypothetical protein
MTEIYTLTQEAIRQVRLVVRQVLRSPEFRRRNTSTIVTHGALATYIGMTGGSGIAARSGTTPGSATVTLYKINSGPTLATATTTVTAYNLSTSAVAASAYVVIMQEQITGKFICVWEDCT